MIRDNLSVFALVTEDTGIGDFYLKTFFPVIFPILITVACFIFVIGCIGYCGVFTKSQTLLGWVNISYSMSCWLLLVIAALIKKRNIFTLTRRAVERKSRPRGRDMMRAS